MAFITFTANERGLGSVQKDALQYLVGRINGIQHKTDSLATGVFYNQFSGRSSYLSGEGSGESDHFFDASRVARTSSETRSSNTAMSPRIYR